MAAVGRLMYPPLREKGYNERFATGVLTSSGAIAIVIPPSISMILYGASAEQSVALLFIAGVFPRPSDVPADGRLYLLVTPRAATSARVSPSSGGRFCAQASPGYGHSAPR